ncbi:MAG TPA: sigma 54-interacting transcriptional regulator [Polyangiaceae bacterium]
MRASGGEVTLDTLELPREPVRGRWMLELGTAHGLMPVPIKSGQRLTLGSGIAACVRLEDRAVSRAHCTVTANEYGVTVEDLDSRNGVFVGGARVPSAMLHGRVNYFVIGRSVVNVRAECADDTLLLEESLPGLIGNSAPMRRVATQVRLHASKRVPVLLEGESGTGKDVVARALHTLARRSGAYLPLNVGALPESLSDAELFGHRRGAFTGAIASRSGAFEQAHKGTLFLDEIADLPPAVQIKLLRVVEDGQVRPVGAVEPIQVDVRIISASWASLPERVAEGRFRADLYHRLATVVIRLPPLRERKSDIPAISEVLLARMRTDVGPRRLSSSALARLVVHEWPGNVRELMSVLYRAAVASAEVEIAAHHLEFQGCTRISEKAMSLSADEARELLARCGNNVSAAARAARVARSTFRAWLGRSSSDPAVERAAPDSGRY